MEVACVGVEDGHLLCRRPHDAWMTVADVRHIVVGVEVTAALVVEEVLPPSTDNFQRLTVGEAQIATDAMSANGQCLASRRWRRGKSIRWNTHDQVRVRRKVEPNIPLSGSRDAREIGAKVEQIGDEL